MKTMRNNNLIGTGVALITPFNNDGSLDLLSLDKLIDYLLTNGINYFVVLGTTAESVNLSKSEQDIIINHIKKKVDNQVPIVLGLGGNNTSEIIRRMDEINFEGIEAILSVSPYYNKPSQQGLFEHYDLIASKSPVDILLYNVPARTSSNIDNETIISLAVKHKNIIGVKEASGSISKCMNLISTAPDDFMIISGDDKMTYPIMTLGGVGVISVQGMAFPSVFSKMVNYALNNNFIDAKRCHYQLLESVDMFYVDGNPSGIKEALFYMGICRSNQVRLPLVKMKDSNAKKIHKFL